MKSGYHEKGGVKKGRRTVNVDVGLAFMSVLTLLEGEVGRSLLGLSFHERSCCCIDGKEAVDYEALEGNHCVSMFKLLLFRVSVMECGAFVEKIEADEDGQDGSSYAFALTTQSARFRISIIIKLAIISGVYGSLLNSLTTRSLRSCAHE